MNVNSAITFQQTWNQTISIETENAHASRALWYHTATIISSLAFITFAVVSSIVFPEFATLILIGVLILSSPAIELSQHFLLKAQESKKLEEQARDVREIYKKNKLNKEKNPELEAFCTHWKLQAEKQQRNYEEIHRKYLEKEKETDKSPLSINKYKINSLEAEKVAKTVAIYSLFLESLKQNPILFEDLFCKYGDTLSQCISSFATWDARDPERRAMDSLFNNQDSLLLFNNLLIPPISYLEVDLDYFKDSLKNRLFQAFKQGQTA